MTPKQQEKAFSKIAINLNTIDYIDEKLTNFKNIYLQLKDQPQDQALPHEDEKEVEQPQQAQTKLKKLQAPPTSNRHRLQQTVANYKPAQDSIKSS